METAEQARAAEARPPEDGYPDQEEIQYCNMPPHPVPVLSSDLDPGRIAAILDAESKWVNGTVLHYYFFDRETDRAKVRLADGSTRWATWVGAEDQKAAVRQAFKTWKDLGIGLDFVEVADRNEAEVRIGFQEGGSWSFLGDGVLRHGANARTMNFGWDVTSQYGRSTALHEIGHTLGMPHEHQNPFAGIVWDEERVYTSFAGPPNNWPRSDTFHNVLRKLDPRQVEGSEWDPDSVMEYRFGPGLIKEPAQYRSGVRPPGTLSPADKAWALKWYPPLEAAPAQLEAFKSTPLTLGQGEQADFTIVAPATRTYQVGTFGAADTLLVLFEDVNGELRHVAADDDSGTGRNAKVRVKLFKGRRYVVRLRLYWATETGETAVMFW